MILHGEQGHGFVTQTFIGVVVEIEVGDFNGTGRQGVRIDAETVILRCDFNLTGEQIFYGMIGAVMAELQLVGLAAERKTAELVTQADSENGHSAGKPANIFNSVGGGFGSPGPFERKTPSGFMASTSSAEVCAGTTETSQW